MSYSAQIVAWLALYVVLGLGARWALNRAGKEDR